MSQHREPQAEARTVIIDVHTHTFCPAVEPLVRDLPGYGSIPYKRDMSAESAAVDKAQGPALQRAFNTLAQRRADMAAMGVDAQVVAPAPGQQHYWLGAGDLLARISAMQNDHVAALVAEAPDILAGLGTLPMADVGASVMEARRAAGLGLRGFQIDSRVNERELSDPAFDPLYETLAALETPLVIHPLGFSDGARLGAFFMVNTVGQPLEETIAFQHLVLGGVMDRHPGLEVLICHGGGYVPSYVGRLDHAWERRSEMRACTKRPPSAYLNRFYYDTCVFRADLVENLVRLAGADRVLLGSDYPFDMGDRAPLTVLEGLSTADRARITAGNAATLFRFRTG